MSPAQWRSARPPRPVLFAAALLLLLLPALYFLSGLLRRPPLDPGSLGVLLAYARTPDGHGWTDADEGSRLRLGRHTRQLGIPSNALHHVHTNTTVDLDQYLHPLFNLALTVLPRGSAWDYVGMARVFGMPTAHLQTGGKGMVEEMVAM